MADQKARISSKETARVFLQSMSCSQALMTVLDRALGYPTELEERAAHALAGGVMNRGLQCGMVSGAALAAGAEAARRFGSGAQAEAAAIFAAKKLLESFRARTSTADCFEITGANLMTFSGRMKYMFTGKANACTRLAVKWAPEARDAILAALDEASGNAPDLPVSCASLAARKMGASDIEAVTCAGLSGGTGLEGNYCGALGAAIWLTTLRWYQNHPEVGESLFRALRHEMSKKIDFFPNVVGVTKKFLDATGGRMRCAEIIGRNFKDIDDHAEFLRNGGCADIIAAIGSE